MQIDYTLGRKMPVYGPIKPIKVKPTRIMPTDPRISIVDPNTGVTWSYAEQTWAERLVKRGTNDCWSWLGPFHRQGYGMVSVHHTGDGMKNGMMNVQRLVMAIHLNRPLAHDERVTSTCKNVLCTNPARPRRRKYTSEFFIKNFEVLLTCGPEEIDWALGLPLGRGHCAKFAFRRWIQRGMPRDYLPR